MEDARGASGRGAGAMLVRDECWSLMGGPIHYCPLPSPQSTRMPPTPISRIFVIKGLHCAAPHLPGPHLSCAQLSLTPTSTSRRGSRRLS